MYHLELELITEERKEATSTLVLPERKRVSKRKKILNLLEPVSGGGKEEDRLSLRTEIQAIRPRKGIKKDRGSEYSNRPRRVEEEKRR